MQLQILKALRFTIAVLLSLYLAMLFGFKESGWAVTSVLIVSLGLIGEIRRKWWQRISGHFLGCCSGFLFIWTWGDQHFTVLIFLPLIAAILSYLSFTQFLLKDFFKWICVGFTIVVAASIDNPYIAFQIAVERFYCIVIGSSITYVLFTIVPLDSDANIDQYYKSLITIVSKWSTLSSTEIFSNYISFSLKQSLIKMLIAVNYKSYIFENYEYVLIVNRLSILEQLARDIYTIKYKEECSNDISSWLSKCFSDLLNDKYCQPYNGKDNNILIDRIYKDFVDLQLGYGNNQLSHYRWRWQNRIFGLGTDSPALSALIQFLGCFIALILWQNGWPNGQSILILTFIILLLCQYGERISPATLVKGFSLGAIYSFPLFILVFPYILTPTAFWFYIILLFLPLSYLHYGNYENKGVSFILFAAALILNVNSNNYIQSDSSFINYIDFLFALIALMIISCSLLSILTVRDNNYRINQQYQQWCKLAGSLLTTSNVNMKYIAILERQSELIISIYSKLDNTQQIKWKSKISSIPLVMNKIRYENN